MLKQELRLNCHRCGDFMEYYRKRDDPNTVIRCDGCGKKHSDDSLFMVNPNRQYDRAEDGTLLENLP